MNPINVNEEKVNQNILAEKYTMDFNAAS